ncbi:FadR/GntR family transcriptional regulator [Nocardioides speluncae]|uniref:FadR/GntR family transcriptional regulator n=1 Tax=Nocardioides speluncae TaxID=2670337 RepID=UPI000D691731|nr:GntR family transcriptional regulator [Nocardioides speluncae]
MTLRHASRSRSAIFAPLGDPGRATRVEQRLADAIRSGMLADGERLPSEQELASMLGVATVTAREALVALRNQGLVTTVRGRGGGSFVTRPKQSDESALQERLTHMSLVELRDRGTLYRVILAGCAELAAPYADELDAESLRDLLVDEGVDDVGAWRHASSELYLSIAALTQSARMTREVVRHEADFGVLLKLPLTSPEFRKATRVRHLELVEAIAAHDAGLARRAAQEQVAAAIASLVDLHAGVR